MDGAGAGRTGQVVLLEITEQDGVRIDLAYKKPDNLAGRPVYAPQAQCVLRPEAAACLRRAVAGAARCGLRIVVYDAYRPAAAQAVFWDVLPDARYVADPVAGSNHTRGVAVDVGLLDAAGQPLDMGTGFDDMREQSHHHRDDLPAAIQRNRHLLLGIMLQAGFQPLATEWWHYELPGAHEYPLIAECARVPVIG